MFVLIVLAVALGASQPGQAQDAETVVQTAATEVLSSRHPESASQLDVRVRRVRGDIDTTRALRVQFSDAGGQPTGLSRVDLRVRGADGTWEEAGWALLRVARLDSVVTVQGRVRKGETIPRSELETAWLKTTDIPGEPIQAADVRTQARQEELVATRHLRSGRVLRERDVRRPYTTDTGSSIRLHYRRGRLRFRLSCKAREPGLVDEVIRVHCPEINTMYRARITAENTAKWVETL